MKLILVLALVFFNLSCSNQSIKDQVSHYCSCLKENKQKPLERDKCLDMMNDLLEKHAADANALAEIIEEVEKCY
jgi:hypothetical protein